MLWIQRAHVAPRVVGLFRSMNPLLVNGGPHIMNPTPVSPAHGLFAVTLAALLVMALLASPATAADTASALPAVLPALDMMDIVHDRSRLIQFSIVAVALGIALLWWGNKTH